MCRKMWLMMVWTTQLQKQFKMIQPIRNQILVKCFKGAEKSAGGIFVPDAFRSESNKVEVVATGNGTPKKPMTVKAGQIGFRVKSWGQAIEENGEKYYLMEDSAIIAIEQ